MNEPALGQAPITGVKAELVAIEERIVGWMLAHQPAGAIEFARSAIPPSEAELFEAPLNRVFAAIGAQADADLSVSPASIKLRMASDPGLAELDASLGAAGPYLMGLAAAAPAFGRGADDLRRLIEREARTWRNLRAAARRVDLLAEIARLAPTGDPALIKVFDEYRSLTVCDRPGGALAPILSSADFVQGFTAPDYVLDGILQRGFCYSLTAPTGAGKTAIALLLAAHVALGRSFANHGVQQGRVLMLVGENPDDVRMRWIALAHHHMFEADNIDVHFMPGVFSIRDQMGAIENRAKEAGGFSLVIVDTSAAYFEGDEENSNKQLGDHARMLRALTQIEGSPTVIANCHPVKGAGPDNLVPRGGGAFLNEVDGNLSCKADGVIELHWQGKFRGPDFRPIAFELLPVTCPRLVNARGALMPSVVASVLSDAQVRDKANEVDNELRLLLLAMADAPGSSVAKLAEALNWRSASGMPAKSKVHRKLEQLKRQHLAINELDGWRLTSAGEKAAKRVES